MILRRCGSDAVPVDQFPTEETAVTEGPGPDRRGAADTVPTGTVLTGTVLTDTVLAQVICTAVIDAPAAKVDLFEWLRTLPDREFQRCAPPDHKAAGYTVTDDGAPQSVMVETIGSALFVHHFAYQVAGRAHCRLLSVSDVLTPDGWTTCQLGWELSADPLDDGTSRCTSALTCHPTAGWLQFIAAGGQPFDAAAGAVQAALDDHCRRETPRLAESIGRHANALN
jgi:hypothetical protein